MVIKLPEGVKQILGALERAGFEAFAVGGCVRDSILGRTPNDWDVTTSAAPAQVKTLFRHTVDTGIAHGTVTVLLGGEAYEVTTYRIDGEYADGRHPNGVTFTDSLTEDLRRRDFTINAMAYNESRGLVDVFGGARDLESGVIRCVGDPGQRFGEDALRMLRAVRFAAQLGFSVDTCTQDAIREMAGRLRAVSAERIRAELVKLLESPHPGKLLLAYDLGMTAVFLPEFDAAMQTPQNNPHHCYSVGMHTIKAVEAACQDRIVRLTMLLHDLGKPQVRQTVDGMDHFLRHAEVSGQIAHTVLRRLRFDNETIRQVCALVRNHDKYPKFQEGDRQAILSGKCVIRQAAVRRMASRVGPDLFWKLLDVLYADVCAQSDFHRQEKLILIGQMRALYQTITEEKQCLSRKELAVSGTDLIRWGMPPGRQIGQALDRLLQEVIEDPARNTKEYLKKTLEEWQEI